MTRKLNDIRRTATFAWSPGHQLPMIATGTRSGALDDSFSNASELEIFKLDLNPESKSLEPTNKVSTNSRFNKLAWGHATTEKPFGIIAGGMESGELELWDPSAIHDNKSTSEALILRNSTHTGTLRALNFNLFQTNLLASAGSNSEVYIWDLNNPTTPYTPGAKSNKMDDISSVAWNCQVQHIVSTASTNGYTVVWDLRNKKEVMTLAYAGQNTLTGGRGTISSIAWHPDVATQIVTASDDDQNPVISLWDLRHAHSPEKTLAGHTKGVLDVSWCKQDSDLLISSGKDCKTLCWNPNTGELNGELASNHKWTFEVDWCPRNPDLVASSSFDGTINVFSIQGSQDKSIANQQTAAPVSDDPFDAALLAAQPSHKTFELKDPPKWLRRPVGASFGFSGKLVTFNSKLGQAAASTGAASTTPGSHQNSVAKRVSRPLKITTIETDPEIIKRSEQLESVTTEELGVDALIEDRIQENNEKDKQDWEVLKTLFSDNAREHLMTWLGFEKEQVVAAAQALLEEKNSEKDIVKEEGKEGESKVEEEEVEEKVVKKSEKKEATSIAPTDASTLFGESSQVETPDTSFFGQVGSSQQVTPVVELNSPLIETIIKSSSKSFHLYPDACSEADRLITRAIVLGDFESAVNVCLATDRFSDALILAICGGSDLLARTQKVYFKSQSKQFAYLRLLEGIVEEDLSGIVRDASLEEWASILVVLCTFAQSKDFGPLCQVLGDRLLADETELAQHATLFYLAAGNLEKVVKIWISQLREQEEKKQENYGVLLQAFVEKVTIFRKAIDYEDNAIVNQDGDYVLSELYDKYCEYAELMAAQGKLSIALKYISLVPANYAAAKSRMTSGSVVRDRVFHASAAARRNKNEQEAPLFPFEKKLLSSHKQEPIQLVDNPHQYNAAAVNNNRVKSPPVAMQQQQQTNYYAPIATVPQQQQQYSPSNNNYNQQTSHVNVGYNNTYAPAVAAATTNAYAPQQQKYKQVPVQQQYGQVPTQYGTQLPPTATVSPPPPVPPKATATGAWNDPPMLPSPKVKKYPIQAQQAQAQAQQVGGPVKRVTTPFANSSSPSSPSEQQGPPQGNMYGQQQQQNNVYGQQQQQQVVSPPPMNAIAPPPMRGLGGPAQPQPPPPPSSNTTTGAFYSAYQQPHQFLQQQRNTPPPPQQQVLSPPPPMNAVAPSPVRGGGAQPPPRFQ